MANISEARKRATTYLRSLARRRRQSVVTADDVHRFIDNNNLKLNQRERLSFIRSVLNEPTFFTLYSVPSTRPEARGRRVRAWAPTN